MAIVDYPKSSLTEGPLLSMMIGVRPLRRRSWWEVHGESLGKKCETLVRGDLLP